MRRTVLLAVLSAVLAATPLAAQSEGPHVYRINHIQVLDAAYYTYLRDVLYPVYDQFVKMGILVSYDGIRQTAGAGEVDMLGISEFTSWDDGDGMTPAAYAQASQAALGKPWTEAVKDVDLSKLRKVVRTEIYWSIRP